jgi:hypothetical protein
MDARPMSALPPGFVLDRDRPKSELRSLFATMQSQRGGGELRQLLQGRAQAPGPVGPALPPGFVLDTPTRHLDASRQVPCASACANLWRYHRP